jgi:hypothetical protein
VLALCGLDATLTGAMLGGMALVILEKKPAKVN